MLYDYADYSGISSDRLIPLLISERGQALLLAAIEHMQNSYVWLDGDDETNFDLIEDDVSEAIYEIIEEQIPVASPKVIGLYRSTGSAVLSAASWQNIPYTKYDDFHDAVTVTISTGEIVFNEDGILSVVYSGNIRNANTASSNKQVRLWNNTLSSAVLYGNVIPLAQNVAARGVSLMVGSEFVNAGDSYFFQMGATGGSGTDFYAGDAAPTGGGTMPLQALLHWYPLP